VVCEHRYLALTGWAQGCGVLDEIGHDHCGHESRRI
jgi:hypothetical protein